LRPKEQSRLQKLTLAWCGGLIEIVRVMCDDFRGTQDGFPDMIHVRDGKVSFVEVKAEGDAIRPAN
jgi:DNA polymerase III subunit epsilon